MGRQSDSNVERTLGHVEPTMGGAMTLLGITLTFTLSCLGFTTAVARNSPSPLHDVTEALTTLHPSGPFHSLRATQVAAWPSASFSRL